MSLIALVLLAFGMSMDAFAAAVVRGAACKRINAAVIWRTALIFGAVETVTPLIGWAVGHAAQPFIEEYDHWVAFILLLFLGLRMIRESFGQDDEAAPEGDRQPLGLLIMTAVATSIDSMIVGVGLAFLEVNIWATALAIGTATTLMAATGMGLGRILGKAAGKRAEFLGGLLLIGIGTSILLDHLGLS